VCVISRHTKVTSLTSCATDYWSDGGEGVRRQQYKLNNISDFSSHNTLEYRVSIELDLSASPLEGGVEEEGRLQHKQ
jgi:hypothetical protein